MPRVGKQSENVNKSLHFAQGGRAGDVLGRPMVLFLI